MQKAVLKNFAIFTGKRLCWSFFLITLQLQTPTQVLSHELLLLLLIYFKWTNLQTIPYKNIQHKIAKQRG